MKIGLVVCGVEEFVRKRIEVVWGVDENLMVAEGSDEEEAVGAGVFAQMPCIG